MLHEQAWPTLLPDQMPRIVAPSCSAIRRTQAFIYSTLACPAPQVQTLEAERDELAAANDALQRSIEGDLLQQQVLDLM